MIKYRIRDHSLRFSSNIVSDYQVVDLANENVLSLIVDLRKKQGKRINDYESLRLHIKLIILNGYLAYRSPPYVYRVISRRAPDYSKYIDRYVNVMLSVHHVRGVMDDLQRLGLIKVFLGYFNRQTGAKFLTRFRAKRKLVEMMENLGVNKSMISFAKNESIRLRDVAKKEIDYEDSDLTRKMRTNLDLINKEIKKRNIHLSFTNKQLDDFYRTLAGDLKRGPIDFNSTALHRTFNNGSFEQGGRFYGGWWQNIPREARPYIEIDYKETVEIDYAGLHIRMLYSQAFAQCPDDPYDLKEFPRVDQKVAILTIINAGSRREAIQSLMSTGMENVVQLCDALSVRHSPIQDSFFSGQGIKLQFLDSQIAESVMLKVIALGGIALPVHDSFIVRVGREEELENAMDLAFQEIFPNVVSKHKRKETLYQRWSRENPRVDDDFSFFNLEDHELQMELEKSGDFR